MAVNVAVVGATGAVGDLMRKVLAERALPDQVDQVPGLREKRRQNRRVRGETVHRSSCSAPRRSPGVQIVLSSTPRSVSKEYSPIAAKAGAIVVDNSSAWRMDPDCPLVVPEVNADQLHHIKKGIVANPNCVAIPLCVALKPLHDLAQGQAGRRRTYQSSSGKGAKGLADFEAQVDGVGRGRAGPGPDRAHGAARRQRPHPRLDARPERVHRGREQGRQRDAEDPRRRDDRRLPDVRARAGEGGPLARRSPSSSTGRCRWPTRRRRWRRPRASCSWTRRRAEVPAAAPRGGERPHVRRPRAAGPEQPERAEPVGRRRQPPQGRGDERRAVRGGIGAARDREVKKRSPQMTRRRHRETEKIRYSDSCSARCLFV